MLKIPCLNEDRLVHIDPARLVPHPDNPRTHSKEQVRKIAASIRRFGFRNPVLVDENNNVVAGHGRLLAAAELKLATVPTLVLANMTEAERRAYVIADNRLAELAGWDEDRLAGELAAIGGLDADFDLSLSGFDGGALEKLLELAAGGGSGGDELVDVNTDRPVTSRTGDIWILGDHRLIPLPVEADERHPKVIDVRLGSPRNDVTGRLLPENTADTSTIPQRCGRIADSFDRWSADYVHASSVPVDAVLRIEATDLEHPRQSCPTGEASTPSQGFAQRPHTP